MDLFDNGDLEEFLLFIWNFRIILKASGNIAAYVNIHVEVGVESLPSRGNGQRAENFSLLRAKETDDGQTETNKPIRYTIYRQR